jgi:hypothetical protein
MVGSALECQRRTIRQMKRGGLRSRQIKKTPGGLVQPARRLQIKSMISD